MQELHIKRVATHDDPELCSGAREGGGGALTRGARLGPRNVSIWDAEGVPRGGRPHWRLRCRERSRGLSRSESVCMCGVSTRKSREIRGSPLRPITGTAAQGRLRPHA